MMNVAVNHSEGNDMSKERRQEIKQLLLAHLEDALEAFWEHEISSSEFPVGWNITVRFGQQSIDNANRQILNDARKYLDIVGGLIGEGNLEPRYRDQFTEEFIARARAWVEVEYAAAGGYQEEAGEFV